MSTHRIAIIAGDGIGKEVMPEGLRVLERAAERHAFRLDCEHHDFASCGY
jgi:tartrate dehydrogenase/decarboxylase/D-malate dehydrogenase